MDFNSTIDLIIKDLNEASEIIDDLKKYPGVPALQVELAKSKCRSAGDVIALLKNLADAVPVQKEPIQEKPKKPEAAASEILTKQPIHEKPKKPEAVVSEIITFETFTVADKFDPPSDLYDEKIATGKTEKDLSDQLKANPIASLSEVIGIGEKFLFIGEIFKGDKEAYSQALSRLDKTESLDDAMAIIMSYTDEKSENEAVVQLLNLVKLKLLSNE
jgi:hypothetical protein